MNPNYIAASSGLADGNTWIGDTHLNTEAATTLELGLDYQGNRITVRPTIFVSQVDNFVQSLLVDKTPDAVDSRVEMISSINGDPSPLCFANVDDDSSVAVGDRLPGEERSVYFAARLSN